MFDNEIILTADGSHSIHSAQFGVDYHSKHGAIQESQHVFIKQGLRYLLDTLPNEIDLLEVGMGSGLNVLLTALYTLDKSVKVRYTALEAFPIDEQVIDSLNYSELLPTAATKSLFQKVHSAAWEENVALNSNFSLIKRKVLFSEFSEKDQFDLIYFDAFAPTAQPELWTTEALAPFVAAMKSGGSLTTYCAKGAVRRSFVELGCVAERLDGPPGKREMLRILKK